MFISNKKRVKKVLGNLFYNPRFVPRYVYHNLLSKKYPLDFCLPWWPYSAIEYVDSIVGGKNVFEYGSGGSTLRYGKKAKKIVSIESDENWFARIRKSLNDLDIQNVEILLKKFDFKNPKEFDKSDYLNSLASSDFDIIIIDGQDYSFNERVSCYKHAENFVKEGSIIIVDDFWRYEILKEVTRAKRIKTFESVGPCRYGVTSTGIFYF